MREEVERGRQAYVVCARIGDERVRGGRDAARCVEVFDELPRAVRCRACA
ncbi:MAG: hypothetical protein WKF83_11625 [Nocardioidaceae bacterium]